MILSNYMYYTYMYGNILRQETTMNKVPKGLPFFPLLQLHYLTNAHTNRIMELAHCPIHREEFVILRELYLEPGLSQTSLAERMAKDRNNLSRTCSELERKGLIRRASRAEDRRHYILELTEYGTAVFLRADKAMEHYRSLTRKGYSPEEWKVFKETMMGYYQNLIDIVGLTDQELVPDENLRQPIVRKSSDEKLTK